MAHLLCSLIFSLCCLYLLSATANCEFLLHFLVLFHVLLSFAFLLWRRFEPRLSHLGIARAAKKARCKMAQYVGMMMMYFTCSRTVNVDAQLASLEAYPVFVRVCSGRVYPIL